MTWLNVAMPLLMMPVLTRFLTPHDYGMSAMWQVLLTFTMPIVGISVHAAVRVRYFQTSSNPAERQLEMRNYIASLFPILAVSALIALIANGLGLTLIQRYLLDASGVWIFAVPVAAAATCLTNITLAYTNAEMRAKVYAAFTNSQVFLISAFSVLFVVGLGWNWTGRVAGYLAGVLFCAAAAMLYLRQRGLLGGKVKAAYVRHAVCFALPLLPHVLASALRSITDRLFLSQITSLSELGLFSVALSMAGVFDTLGHAMQQAWVPWLYAHLSGEKIDRARIVKVTAAILIGLSALGIAFAALGPFIFGTVLGSRFADSARFIWWLVGASVLRGAYYFIAPYIAYVELNKYSSYISLTTLGVNIVLNVVLIRFFGVMGVAASNLLTALFEFVVVFIVSNRCVPMPWLSVLRQLRPREWINKRLR